MFSNTLTLTINAVAKVLNRVNQDNFGSSYLFESDLERITMQIRHSTDKTPNGPVKRHNVYIEQTIFATTLVPMKYFSTTYTLRNLEGSGPSALDLLSQASLTLLGTLDTGLTVGEN